MENVSQDYDFSNACRILNIEDMNPRGLYSSHADKIISIFFEIIKDDDVKDDKKELEKVVTAKNQILYEIVKNESTSNNVFVFENLDLRKYINGNQCKICKGSGVKIVELPGIIKDMDKCPECLGTGIEHKGCPDCHETGWDRGGICIACKGKGRIPFRKNAKRKCSYCHGNKFINRRVDTGIIVSFRSCTACRGFGDMTLRDLLPPLSKK